MLESRTVAAALAGMLAAAALAGCGSGGAQVTDDLQSTMKQQITSENHRPVSAVSCTPSVDEVIRSTQEVLCTVDFVDGSSYRTSATITDTNTTDDEFGGPQYQYDWTSPPPLDLTRANLPGPQHELSPTSPRSLFREANLARVEQGLAAKYANGQLIVAMTLYPSELVAVLAGNDSDAQLVTVDATGRLTVLETSTFDGTRSGIEINQLLPAVPQRLAQHLAAREHVPTSTLTRFAMTFLPGSLVGWDIYTSTGARFQAYLQGQALTRL